MQQQSEARALEWGLPTIARSQTTYLQNDSKIKKSAEESAAHCLPTTHFWCGCTAEQAGFTKINNSLDTCCIFLLECEHIAWALLPWRGCSASALHPHHYMTHLCCESRQWHRQMMMRYSKQGSTSWPRRTKVTSAPSNGEAGSWAAWAAMSNILRFIGMIAKVDSGRFNLWPCSTQLVFAWPARTLSGSSRPYSQAKPWESQLCSAVCSLES